MQLNKRILGLGIDIGSTTVKIAVTDITSKNSLFTLYKRHNAKQAEMTEELLSRVTAEFPDSCFCVAVCGSGGRPIADAMGVYFIQEVVANAAAVRALYPNARTAAELGGQDAKVVFFNYDESTKDLIVSDMRMNGSCAGGTGAFIDEIAVMLNAKPEEFESLAARGSKEYSISGRCGVFAKTDIQPLLIQGAAREDIALSVFHAIAKQTVGGLSQGLEFAPPVIFEGGPFTYNPTLIKVFAQRLGLKNNEIIIPEDAETIIARGAVIAYCDMFDESKRVFFTPEQLIRSLSEMRLQAGQETNEKPFFLTPGERDAFIRRYSGYLKTPVNVLNSTELSVYIGIDSGSSTSKIALIDEAENVVDIFYSKNNGESLQVVKNGLMFLYEKYKNRGITLRVLGLCTTGYGEMLFEKAFGADCHTVETVAHAESCRKYSPDTDFMLDIGGQDMKAVWMKNGVITNIALNEACSSGCGSFIENFADTLGIPADGIADAAYASKNPAALGSRCTVFMNSTIVSEQRSGKDPNDIIAGLCRALIENVFTKVIRISSTDALGKKITAQGGAFKNAALFRALEEYLGTNVTLAPYPGEMGAIGAALSAKRHLTTFGYKNKIGTSFIGFDKVKNLDRRTDELSTCEQCENRCRLTVTCFSTGSRYVTGNRCEKGARDIATERNNTAASHPFDMFKYRSSLLFREHGHKPSSKKNSAVIGIPRVLEFWESAPFWSTFFNALGFKTVFSDISSHELYENGLSFVASDTVCFPAKLVHGHIKNLAEKGAKRIFMPYMMNMPSSNHEEKNNHVCPVIKGYPLVINYSDTPHERYGVIFDTPIFHWYSENDKKRQIYRYAAKTLGVQKKEAHSAYRKASAAMQTVREQLINKGKEVLNKTRNENGFAVVLAGRPYHTDSFISHDISTMFTKQGINVITMDALIGADDVSLRNTRCELTNTYHAKMLSAAKIAAETPELEFAQIVSFGCGHDAILSDEVVRVAGEYGKKPPLIIKVDEGDAQGSLRIRVQSFIETVRIRRSNEKKLAVPLPCAYPIKFTKGDKSVRTLLVPNLSHPMSTLLSAVLRKEGYSAKTVPIAGASQIKTGKRYTHNDICFPCQVVIGELIEELQKGDYKQDTTAVAMMKLNCECRLAQYPALLRKALNNAGFDNVPILTNDLRDIKQLHPGFKPFGIQTLIIASRAFIMLDIMEELRRMIRPYEIKEGQTNHVFEVSLRQLIDAVQRGLKHVENAFNDIISAFSSIEYDRSVLKPRVLVVGEFLVTAHPGSNFRIEEYLEKNGMETIFPRVTDTVRKEFLTPIWERQNFGVKHSRITSVVDKLFDIAQNSVEKTALMHPLYTKAPRPRDLYEGVRELIPRTLNCGEGWLMAAEIAHYAKQGVRNAIILQPFGCLPNHVCGRGMTKRLKKEFPLVHILPLDFDPDTGYANVENRLQMQIMNNRFNFET